MGYDLHISRVEHWVYSETAPITLDEWKSYIESDSELKIDPINNHRDDELTVLWYGDDGIFEDNEFWLCWWKGQIYAKNPDEALIEKMCKIAAFFNAKVLGDDDEEYILTADGLDSIHSNDRIPNRFRPKKNNVIIRFLNTVCKVLVVVLVEPLARPLNRFRSRWFGVD